MGFWGKRHYQIFKIFSADNYFCVFEPPLWIYELLWNTKLKYYIVKFRFLAFLSDFFKFCPQNLQHFEDVPVKFQKQFSQYIKFIWRRTCAKKFKSKFHVSGWFPGLQNLDVFWKIYCKASLEMIFRQK